MKMLDKKGQGSFLGGDIPAIIMIVVSISFFFSSIYLAVTQFESSKSALSMEAALVDAASTFLKENAKIRPTDLTAGSQFWELKLLTIEETYNVQVYVELESLVDIPGSSTKWTAGDYPDPTVENVLTKRFPIALKIGATDLEVLPALIKVTVYISGE